MPHLTCKVYSLRFLYIYLIILCRTRFISKQFFVSTCKLCSGVDVNKFQLIDMLYIMQKHFWKQAWKSCAQCDIPGNGFLNSVWYRIESSRLFQCSVSQSPAGEFGFPSDGWEGCICLMCGHWRTLMAYVKRNAEKICCKS